MPQASDEIARNGLRPFLKWPGGKRWLASKIAPYIKGAFGRYIEPFLGGGAFLFALEPSKGIVSDINKDLISCYEAIRKDALRVLLEFNELQISKEEYYRIRDRWSPKCEFKRAARLVYLLRHSWNGLYRVNQKGHFNVPYCPRPRKDKLKMETMTKVQSILRRVELKCQDFEEVICNTKEGDFIFADPPYFENDHEKFGRYSSVSFKEGDQERLARSLVSADHRGASWILTNGSLEKVRKHFHRYEIYIVPRFSSIAANPKCRGMIREYLVISNSSAIHGLSQHLRSHYKHMIS